VCPYEDKVLLLKFSKAIAQIKGAGGLIINTKLLTLYKTVIKYFVFFMIFKLAIEND